MKQLILAMMIVSSFLLGGSTAFAGPCDHSWQTASDGSSCGGRAASSRPGGR